MSDLQSIPYVIDVDKQLPVHDACSECSPLSSPSASGNNIEVHSATSVESPLTSSGLQSTSHASLSAATTVTTTSSYSGLTATSALQGASDSALSSVLEPRDNPPLTSSNSQSIGTASVLNSGTLPFIPSSQPISYVTFDKDFPSVDAWIDDLVIGIETPTPPSPGLSSEVALTMALVELDRDLPKVALPSFDGSPLAWPRFAEQFFIHIHSRKGLTDARRIEILQSHMKGEAKKLIEGLGYSSVNYAQCLKELKFAFGHKVLVARAYIDAMTSGGTVPSGDASSLRSLYVSVRDCIITLRQMCYVGELNSSDVLQRAINRIPFDKRNKWNDYIRNVCRSREPTLLDLQSWLKDCVESDFCPYAIPAQAPKSKMSNSHQQQNSQTVPAVHYSTMNVAIASNKMEVQPEKTCPLCSERHHVSKCDMYLGKSAEDRYALAMSKYLCLNCLYPGHKVASCTSSNVCRESSCGKQHHTTLHRKKASFNDASVNSEVRKGVHSVKQSSLQFPKSTVYLQILPVTVQGSNGHCINTFAMLDTGSDISLINSDLANDLGLHGLEKNLIVDTMGPSFNFHSKCVNFAVKASKESGSESLYISQAWTRPGVFCCPSFNMSELHNVMHLKGLNLSDVKACDVKLLIGANVPRAHLQLEVRQGAINDPIAILTPLGWCVMGVKNETPFHVNCMSTAHDDSKIDGVNINVQNYNPDQCE